MKRIQRYLCKFFKNKDLKKTFSYLPENIIPYRVYSLEIIVGFLELLLFKLNKEATQEKIVENIINKYSADSDIKDICFIQIKEFIKMMEIAKNKFTSLTNKTFESVTEFFQYCRNYKFYGSTGFLAIKQFIYCQHQQFLFGTASQFRR